MASQIAHIVYAKKYFERLESGALLESLTLEEKDKYPLGKISKDEFFLGCVFPDIRRVDKNVERRDTHMRFKKINLDFSGINSFEAGWKFHLYCDMKREEILNKYDFYHIPRTTDFFNQPAKLLEDEIVYDDYNNWEKLVHYFNKPPQIELDINVGSDSYGLWYAMLAKYMEKKPDERSTRAFLVKMPGFLVDKADEIMKSISILRKNGKVLEILEKVKEEII